MLFRSTGNTRIEGSAATDEMKALARQMGAEGIVLLKNEKNTLPLNPGAPVIIPPVDNTEVIADTLDQLDALIDDTLKKYERDFRITPEDMSPNLRMRHLLYEAHRQTGKRVVVLVDEYDNFILHALGDKKRTDLARQRFQNVFGPLKEMDDHLQFVFVTGISKFSQMGIFSKLNQLMNISMAPIYETICGITEEELTTQLRPDVEQLAHHRKKTFDEQLSELKARYDGYHFSEGGTDLYNPFSLVNAFQLQKIGNYWFDRGTTSALFDMLRQMPPVSIEQLDGVRLPSTAFDLPLDSFDDPLPVLYQSGYLTIRHYDDNREMYTLGFPNGEVRTSFADCLYQYITGSKASDIGRNRLLDAYYDFRDTADLPTFIEAIRTFFAGVPYLLDNHNEHHYHALLYTLLMAFGADVRAEEPTAEGRADLTLCTPKGIYIIEVKYDHSADEAIHQIIEKNYAGKYRLDGRPVVLVGLAFSSAERNITQWKSAPCTFNP